MPEPAIASSIIDLSWLPIGSQVQVRIKSRELLIIIEDSKINKDLSQYSNLATVYLAVFGESQIGPEGARQVFQSKYGLQTIRYFEEDNSFILFVSGAETPPN
jgi:hypothetical protein